MIFKQNFDFRSPLHLCSLLGLARPEVRQDVYRTSDEPSPHPAVSPPVTRYSLCTHLLVRKSAGEKSGNFQMFFLQKTTSAKISLSLQKTAKKDPR